MELSSLLGVIAGLFSGATTAAVGQYNKSNIDQDVLNLKRMLAASINNGVALEKRIHQLETMRGAAGGVKESTNVNGEVAKMKQRISLLEARITSQEQELRQLYDYVDQQEAPPPPVQRPLKNTPPVRRSSQAAPPVRPKQNTQSRTGSQPSPATRPRPQESRGTPQRPAPRRQTYTPSQPEETQDDTSNVEDEDFGDVVSDDTVFENSVRY